MGVVTFGCFDLYVMSVVHWSVVFSFLQNLNSLFISPEVGQKNDCIYCRLQTLAFYHVVHSCSCLEEFDIYIEILVVAVICMYTFQG